MQSQPSKCSCLGWAKCTLLSILLGYCWPGHLQGSGRFFWVEQTKNMKKNLICLIPKIEEPRRLKDLRPISLNNVIYKIMSKIITTLAATFINDIISDKQGAFIKWRLLTENIALDQELVPNMDRKAFGHNVAIKLDMKKYFDKLDWKYIYKVQDNFFFGQRVLAMIVGSIEGS